MLLRFQTSSLKGQIFRFWPLLKNCGRDWQHFKVSIQANHLLPNAFIHIFDSLHRLETRGGKPESYKGDCGQHSRPNFRTFLAPHSGGGERWWPLPPGEGRGMGKCLCFESSVKLSWLAWLIH